MEWLPFEPIFGKIMPMDALPSVPLTPPPSAAGHAEALQSVLRSVVFLVFCLPLMIYADRRLKLLASLRQALFKSANRQ